MAGLLALINRVEKRMIFRWVTHIHRTSVIFLDLKVTFDSVGQIALFSALHRKGMLWKFVTLLRASYLYIHGHSKRPVVFDRRVLPLHLCLTSPFIRY